jgi:hypothetical protein
MEHGPYIAERTQKAVYIVRCLWSYPATPLLSYPGQGSCCVMASHYRRLYSAVIVFQLEIAEHFIQLVSCRNSQFERESMGRRYLIKITARGIFCSSALCFHMVICLVSHSSCGDLLYTLAKTVYALSYC